MPIRCEWPADDSLMILYHDSEWGTPQHNDKVLFEFLVLEGAQAGLSWQTILNKREGYRKAFSGFAPKKVAAFTKKDVERLMKNAGIVRNRLKIESAITNAKMTLEVQKEFGSLDKYLWQFVKGKPIINRPKTPAGVPTTTSVSEAMSKDLKKRGFRFVGPTVCYAFMQATGMVDDHLVGCFKKS